MQSLGDASKTRKLQPAILYNLALTCMAQSDFVGAQQYLSALKSLKPTQTIVSPDLVETMQADIFMRQGKYAEAERVNAALLANTQETLTSLSARMQLAVAEMNLHKHQQAESNLKELIKLSQTLEGPRKSEILRTGYEYLGKVHVLEKKFDLAELDYEAAKKIATSNRLAPAEIASLWNDLGGVLRAQGKLDEALASSKSAFDMNSQDRQANVDYHSNIGCVYFDKRDYKRAEASFDKAKSLASAPPANVENLAQCTANLASLYAKTKRPELARKKFEEAISLARKSPNHSGLSIIESQKTQYLGK